MRLIFWLLNANVARRVAIPARFKRVAAAGDS